VKNENMIDKSIRKYMPTLGLALLWTCLLAGVFWALKFPVGDMDLWWHLASGREMVESKAFLWHEVFSYTIPGEVWINFEWASQVVFYFIFKAFGYWGFFWSQLVLGLISWGLAVLVARTSGLRGALLFLIAILIFKVTQQRLIFRPEIFSLIFFPLTIFIIQKVKESAAPKEFSNGKTYFWQGNIPLVLLFLIGILWNNLHGGFVYGLGLLVLLRIGAGWSGESKEFIRFLEKGIVAFLIAFLINPFGPAIGALHAEMLFQLNDLRGMVREWRVPLLERAPFFWFIVGLTLLLIIRALWRRKRKAYLWIPAAIVFGIWGCLSSRNTYLLGFIFAPLIGNLLRDDDWRKTLSGVRVKAEFALAGALLMVFSVFTFWKSNTPVAWWLFPVQACEFVERNNIRGSMFNTYHYGGYIEWAFGKDRKVFLDGRYLFQPFLVEMMRIKRGMAADLNKEGWRIFLNRYAVDYAIVDYSGENEKFLFKEIPFPLTLYNGVFPREEWALVFWDDAGMVFLKRISKFAALIQRYEYRYLRPFNLAQMEFLIRNRSVPKGEVAGELKRNAREVSICRRRKKIEALLPPNARAG